MRVQLSLWFYMWCERCKMHELQMWRASRVFCVLHTLCELHELCVCVFVCCASHEQLHHLSSISSNTHSTGSSGSR